MCPVVYLFVFYYLFSNTKPSHRYKVMWEIEWYNSACIKQHFSNLFLIVHGYHCYRKKEEEKQLEGKNLTSFPNQNLIFLFSYLNVAMYLLSIHFTKDLLVFSIPNHFVQDCTWTFVDLTERINPLIFKQGRVYVSVPAT